MAKKNERQLLVQVPGLFDVTSVRRFQTSKREKRGALGVSTDVTKAMVPLVLPGLQYNGRSCYYLSFRLDGTIQPMGNI